MFPLASNHYLYRTSITLDFDNGESVFHFTLAYLNLVLDLDPTQSYPHINDSHLITILIITIMSLLLFYYDNLS